MCYKAKICRWFNWNLGFGNAWRIQVRFLLGPHLSLFLFFGLVWWAYIYKNGFFASEFIFFPFHGFLFWHNILCIWVIVF